MSESSISIELHSDSINGFYLIGREIYPMKSKLLISNYDLRLGHNDIYISLLNSDHQLIPSSRRLLQVYRTLSAQDNLSSFERVLITEMALHHQISLLSAMRFNSDQPILKRDLYAILVWFLTSDSSFDLNNSSKMHWHYEDMFGYSQYMNLFQLRPQWLPRPVNKNFYPNAYVTREEFVNLLLLLRGGQDQVSTSMHLTADLNVPNSVVHYIPDHWNNAPLGYVTKQDVLTSFKRVFNYRPLLSSSNPIVIRYNQSFVSSGIRQTFQSLIAGVHYKRFRPAFTRLVSELRDWQSVIQGYLNNAYAFLKEWRHKKSDDETVGLVSMNSKLPNSKNMSEKHRGPSSNKRLESFFITVKPGDTIQKIARQYYGDSKKWETIVQLNQLEMKTITINGQSVVTVHIVPDQTLLLNR